MRYAIVKDGKVVRVVSRLPKSGLPEGYSIKEHVPSKPVNRKRVAIMVLAGIAIVLAVLVFTCREHIRIVDAACAWYPSACGVADGPLPGGDDAGVP